MMTTSKFAIVCILTSSLLPQQASAQDSVSDCLPEDTGDCADEVGLLQNRASSSTILAGSRKLVDTEFVADMVFHTPEFGTLWAAGRMSLKLEGSKLIGFRLVQELSVPRFYEGFTVTYDKLAVRESNGSIATRFQQGTLCGEEGFFASRLLSDLVEVEDGSLTFNGTSCERGMRASIPELGNMTLCLDGAGAPINYYISLSADAVGKSNVAFFYVNATFENVSLGELPEDAFSFPKVCLEGPAPAACPVEEGNEFETMVVTRYTDPPGEECGLGGKQANDDLATVAGGLPVIAGLLFKYLQVFNVTVDRRWGSPLDCNYHPRYHQSLCSDPQGNRENLGRVGRSSFGPGYSGAYGGQCAENDVVGSWYSFPAWGECAAGWAMGYRNCTWKTNSFRLIELSCVFEACVAHLIPAEGSPYTEAIKCVNKARMECPDVSTSAGIQTGTCLASITPQAF